MKSVVFVDEMPKNDLPSTKSVVVVDEMPKDDLPSTKSTCFVDGRLLCGGVELFFQFFNHRLCNCC